MGKKVSIIIPVYNGDSRLEQCLKSIISQTEKNIEIIIVDDGSTDHSFKIIEKYANQDSRILVLRQQNKGVSASRNKAIEKATGKYVMFVDADDELVATAVETLCEIIERENTDIVRFEYTLFNNEKQYSSEHLYEKERLLKKQELYQAFIDTGKLNSVWLDFIRLDLIKKNKILFSKKYILGEDMIFNLELFTKAKSIYYTNKELYIYYINPKGISNNTTFSKLQKKVLDTIETYSYFFQYLSLWNLNTKDNQRKVTNKILEMTHYELKKIIVTDLSKQEKLSFIETYNEKISDLYDLVKMKDISYPLKLLKKKKYMLYYYYHVVYWKLKRILKGSTV